MRYTSLKVERGLKREVCTCTKVHLKNQGFTGYSAVGRFLCHLKRLLTSKILTENTGQESSVVLNSTGSIRLNVF